MPTRRRELRVEAASGLEAIERLSLKRFDALILDLNMPDIGGLEVVQFVRSQDATRSLPIVVVTTRGDDASRIDVLNAGASRFMTKPFAPEAILAEVRCILAAASARARWAPPFKTLPGLPRGSRRACHVGNDPPP